MKKVPVRNLGPTTDLGELAGRLISENKLIHPSKKGLVENLLVELLQHSMRLGGPSEQEQAALRQGTAREDRLMRAQLEAASQASLGDLEQYLEDLYDERLDERIRATAMIAQLFRRPEYYPTLLGHQSLVGALARVLSEDYQRSIDLEINIMSCLFAISIISDFHPLLIENRVGELTMNVSQRRCCAGCAPSDAQTPPSPLNPGG